MQSQLNSSPQPTTDVEAREVVTRLIAERSRTRAVRKPLPSWARIAMRAMPRVLLIATLANLTLGLLAVIAPLLRSALGNDATAWIFSAYAFICPQRPSHTTFVAGEPMAMEQRMVAMYLAFGVVGLLYPRWRELRRPLANWAALLGLAPAVIDVALSTAGIRASTADSRWWTGALASLAIVWWAYPRFEAMLRLARAHVASHAE